jgi:CDP-diacylglycerol---serine O-phosphatidyltransferase
MDPGDLIPMQPNEARRRSLGKGGLRSGVYILPSFFTVANLMCGYYAVLATFEGRPGDFDNAARAIGWAIVFDMLDGRVARAMGTNSEFGKEFDSLADIVSFGIAPAFLAYAWGVRAMAGIASPDLHLIQWGWLVGFFYVASCAWRLARFNIQGMAPGDSRYFVGLPTPAAAGMIAALVHGIVNPIQDPRISVLWLALLVALGMLMASTVRYYSFKDVRWTHRFPSLGVVLLALLVGSIFLFSTIVLPLIASAYLLHGIAFQVVRAVRHRLAARHA